MNAALSKTIRTAVLLDTYQPEFESYLSGEAIDDYLIPGPGHAWYVPSTARKRTFWLAAAIRAVVYRLSVWRGKNRQTARHEASEWLARPYARFLAKQEASDISHVIVAIDFLASLWNSGALAGRKFDVLLTRPPIQLMRERLHWAAQQLPASSEELNEFQVSPDLVSAEAEALARAERVITPHEDLAQFFPNLRKLEWQKSTAEPPAAVHNPQYLLFPASLAAREGAHAAMAAAEEVGMPLLVVGTDAEGLSDAPDQILFTSESEIPWHEVAAVVHPTLFETWPRLHLMALAMGIPVLATAAIGLEHLQGVTPVPFNDETALVRMLEKVLRGEPLSPLHHVHHDNHEQLLY